MSSLVRIEVLILSWLAVAVGSSLAQSIFATPDRIDFSASADSLDLPGLNGLASVSFGVTGAASVEFKYTGVTAGPKFVVVSPSMGLASQGTFVALDPNVVPFMAAGSYSATVTFATAGQPTTSSTSVVVTLTLGAASAPNITGLFSAATLQPEISPGGLVTILGTNLGTPPISAKYDDAGLYPTTLGNTKVTFNGTVAPLLYVSSNQINAVVPYEVTGKTVTLIVSHGQQASASFSAALQDTSPGIFTVNQSGSGQGAILNAGPGANTSTVNSASNPAPKGSAIAIFATGAGLLNQRVQDGSIPLVVAPGFGFLIPFAPVSLTIGGQLAKILYAGAAPFEVFGMLQVNAVIPTSIGSGPQPVVLTIGKSNNASQQVTVAVK